MFRKSWAADTAKRLAFCHLEVSSSRYKQKLLTEGHFEAPPDSNDRWPSVKGLARDIEKNATFIVYSHVLRSEITSMSVICSFYSLVNGQCGPSRGRDDYIPLTECNDDTSVHLASCYLSNEDLSERDLILARAGLFGLDESHIAKMKICPKHRQGLGKFWRPLRSCQYPGHTGKAKVITDRHVINFQKAKEINNLFGKNAGVGSRKYFTPLFQSVKRESTQVRKHEWQKETKRDFLNL